MGHVVGEVKGGEPGTGLFVGGVGVEGAEVEGLVETGAGGFGQLGRGQFTIEGDRLAQGVDDGAAVLTLRQVAFDLRAGGGRCFAVQIFA